MSQLIPLLVLAFLINLQKRNLNSYPSPVLSESISTVTISDAPPIKRSVDDLKNNYYNVEHPSRIIGEMEKQQKRHNKQARRDGMDYVTTLVLSRTAASSIVAYQQTLQLQITIIDKEINDKKHLLDIVNRITENDIERQALNTANDLCIKDNLGTDCTFPDMSETLCDSSKCMILLQLLILTRLIYASLQKKHCLIIVHILIQTLMLPMLTKKYFQKTVLQQ